MPYPVLETQLSLAMRWMLSEAFLPHLLGLA